MLDAPLVWWRSQQERKRLEESLADAQRRHQEATAALERTEQPDQDEYERVVGSHEQAKAELAQATKALLAARTAEARAKAALHRLMRSLEALYDRRFGQIQSTSTVAGLAALGGQEMNRFVLEYRRRAEAFVASRDLAGLEAELSPIATPEATWEPKREAVSAGATRWLTERHGAWTEVIQTPWSQLSKAIVRTYDHSLSSPDTAEPNYAYPAAVANAEGHGALIGKSAAKGLARGAVVSAATGGGDLGLSAVFSGMFKGVTAAFKAGNGRLEQGLVNAALACVRHAEGEMLAEGHGAAMEAVKTARQSIADLSYSSAKTLATQLDQQIAIERDKKWKKEALYVEKQKTMTRAEETEQRCKAQELELRPPADTLRKAQGRWESAGKAVRRYSDTIASQTARLTQLQQLVTRAQKWTAAMMAGAITLLIAIM